WVVDHYCTVRYSNSINAAQMHSNTKNIFQCFLAKRLVTIGP
ncbi:hypothetical protein L325_08345, partial [Yersinia pestis 9]